MSQKISIYRGDSSSQSVSLIDETGSPINITGGTLFFTVKAGYDSDATDSTAIIRKNITSHYNAASGETYVSLSSADTSIAPNDYLAEFQYVSANGTDVVTWPSIGFSVLDDLTRRTA